MKRELKEAFRFYDKEGRCNKVSLSSIFENLSIIVYNSGYELKLSHCLRSGLSNYRHA